MATRMGDFMVMAKVGAYSTAAAPNDNSNQSGRSRAAASGTHSSAVDQHLAEARQLRPQFRMFVPLAHRFMQTLAPIRFAHRTGNIEPLSRGKKIRDHENAQPRIAS